MRRVAIVQARMTSTRLPGKVLADVGGAPMLAQQLRRLRRARSLDEIVVATTVNATDDPVVRLADQEGVRWFRGSEADVLGRYVGAAREAGAEVVVRSTADCPLTEPAVIDAVVDALVAGADRLDYASNVIERSYPQGLDVEALFVDVLARVDRMGRSPGAREHVTQLILRERSELFAVHNVADGTDNSGLRWTVDTAADLQLVRTLYEELDLGSRVVGYRDVLAYVRARPALAALNQPA